MILHIDQLSPYQEDPIPDYVHLLASWSARYQYDNFHVSPILYTSG